MKLLSANAPLANPSATETAAESTAADTLLLPNTEDPRGLQLRGIRRIDLQFPKFTDGRAYSQAFLLRRRLGFKGEIRATGDVLVDQLLHMQRQGFDVAVLRADQNLAIAEAQLQRFKGFYQGDAVTAAPLFQRQAAGGQAA